MANIPELAEEITDRVVATLGNADRQLRDYIYTLTLRQLQRRKNMVPRLNRKEFGELPFGIPYAIVDDWGATFAAEVFRDKSRSRFTK